MNFSGCGQIRIWFLKAGQGATEALLFRIASTELSYEIYYIKTMFLKNHDILTHLMKKPEKLIFIGCKSG